MSIFNQQAKNAEGQAPRRRNVGCLGGCLLFVAIYLITSAVIGLVMSSMMDTSTVELKENTVYRLQLKGTLIEQAKDTVLTDARVSHITTLNLGGRLQYYGINRLCCCAHGTNQQHKKVLGFTSDSFSDKLYLLMVS